MAFRTFVIGDIHGDLAALDRLLASFPPLDDDDTLVFLGDYLDRGPDSAGVVARVRALGETGPAKVVALRGNHEDAWLKVIDEGWPEFVFPPDNGCRACLRSFLGSGPETGSLGDLPDDEVEALFEGSFFPEDVVSWMRALPWWYEDRHGIYVHAGLPSKDGAWLHPALAPDPRVLLWTRNRKFFTDYRGKTVVVGHTSTSLLPPELSSFTPEDPEDMFWAGNSVFAIDTGAGKGGFLTAIELPNRHVYESR